MYLNTTPDMTKPFGVLIWHSIFILKYCLFYIDQTIIELIENFIYLYVLR